MSAPRPLRFGFSPCPNDTFAFFGAVHGHVPTPGFVLRPELHDIETLNGLAAGADPLELTKLSVPALGAVLARYEVLPAGAALGFGCGPLLVARPGAGPRDLAALRGRRVAIPGLRTTARLLFGLFAPQGCELVPMGFEQILPAVAAGACDAGLIIHESRFTYPQHGLVALADLGALWERDTGLPLPLGLIAVRRDLPAALRAAVGASLRDSVALARREPALPRPFVRAHAQEMDDLVCDQHIALYVNAHSEDLGPDGRAAIRAIFARGRERGLLPAGPDPLAGGAP